MRKFKYVVWFDIFDVQEYFNKDLITKEDIKDYLNDMENVCLVNIKSYNDEKGLKDFYEYCNETIEDYNRIARAN